LRLQQRRPGLSVSCTASECGRQQPCRLEFIGDVQEGEQAGGDFSSETMEGEEQDMKEGEGQVKEEKQEHEGGPEAGKEGGGGGGEEGCHAETGTGFNSSSGNGSGNDSDKASRSGSDGGGKHSFGHSRNSGHAS